MAYHIVIAQTGFPVPDVQSRDIKPVKRPQIIGQRRLLVTTYDELHRLRGYQTHAWLLYLDRKDKRFQFFVIIILLQATLFCEGNKAVLHPHCTRFDYVLASITNKIVHCGCHGKCGYNDCYKLFY